MFALETHAGYLSQYSQEPVKHWIFTVSLDKTEEVHKRCTTQLKDLTEKEGQEQSRTVFRFEHCRIWDPICVTFDFILHSWYPGIPLKMWAFPGLHTSSRTIRPTLWWRTCWIFVLVPWHRIDAQISALCISLEFLISQTFLSFPDWSIPFPFQMVSVCFGNIKFLGVKFLFSTLYFQAAQSIGCSISSGALLVFAWFVQQCLQQLRHSKTFKSKRVLWPRCASIFLFWLLHCLLGHSSDRRRNQSNLWLSTWHLSTDRPGRCWCRFGPLVLLLLLCNDCGYHQQWGTSRQNGTDVCKNGLSST